MRLHSRLSSMVFVSSVAGLALSLCSGHAFASRVSCESALQSIRTKFTNSFSGAKASMALFHGDTQLLQASYGDGIDEKTPFLLGSVTKSLNAVVSLRLLEEGRIELDTAILPFLPEIYRRGLPSGWKKITIQNLLNHTSGVPDYINRPDPDAQAHATAFLRTEHSFAELMTLVPKKLDFQPLDKLLYSNTNYLILAQVLSESTGQSFEALLDSQLVDVLGLRETGSMTQSRPLPRIEGGTGIHPANLTGVGNGYSSVEDLSAFVKALDGDKLLSRDSVKKMYTPDPRCRRGDKCGRYGMGLSVRAGANAIRGVPWYFHEGHLSHVSNVIAKMPAKALNLVILTDLSQFNQEAMSRWVFTQLVDSGCL